MLAYKNYIKEYGFQEIEKEKISILKKSGDTFLKVLCCPLFIEV
ncbi:hypothetical protein HMPREF0367_01376 [[Eubacterium] cylindroides ATCC 27803]|uniref:Uncharacterized protein n=1 Tax=Faecalitalea cylindroides ATCC 27803 TaxID=649755 RepID=U2P251_9FIRM|nr:hypothetical protein HMPREF0367_01376 [[Eubacterium] cylindroides ATCC 27803] [Faecalitalea cylindroides ATCC 27803]